MRAKNLVAIGFGLGLFASLALWLSRDDGEAQGADAAEATPQEIDALPDLPEVTMPSAVDVAGLGIEDIARLNGEGHRLLERDAEAFFDYFFRNSELLQVLESDLALQYFELALDHDLAFALSLLTERKLYLADVQLTRLGFHHLEHTNPEARLEWAKLLMSSGYEDEAVRGKALTVCETKGFAGLRSIVLSKEFYALTESDQERLYSLALSRGEGLEEAEAFFAHMKDEPSFPSHFAMFVDKASREHNLEEILEVLPASHSSLYGDVLLQWADHRPRKALDLVSTDAPLISTLGQEERNQLADSLISKRPVAAIQALLKDGGFSPSESALKNGFRRWAEMDPTTCAQWLFVNEGKLDNPLPIFNLVRGIADDLDAEEALRLLARQPN